MEQNKEAVIQHLIINGWQFDGATKQESYRTRSFAYGGGKIVTTGGRSRLAKGKMRITVGLRTICLYKKPDNPEAIPGRGRLAGRSVYTFRDWPMVNIAIKSQKAGGATATIDILDNTIREFNQKK